MNICDHFKVVDYNAKRHRDGVLRLLGNSAYKFQIWSWQFSERILDPESISLVAESDRGEVIGFNGVMPVSVSEHGVLSPAIWSCDFVVDEKWRGAGVGKAIKKHLNQRHDRIMSLGISDMAVPVLEKSGWHKGSAVCSLRRYNGWDFERRILLRPWQWILACRYHKPRQPWLGNIEISENLPTKEELDALWMRVSSGYERIVARDASYVNWRYGKFPLGSYQFHVARMSGEIQGILVCRTHQRQSLLVDYIGPNKAIALKQALFSSWCAASSSSIYWAVTTSDTEWKDISLSFGFRITDEQRFYIRDLSSRYQDWTVMMGDSDGEFLAHARNAVTSSVQGEKRYTIINASTEQFGKLKDEWDALVANSDADPLFCSWAWQYNWWSVWARDLNLRLRLYLVRDDARHLVGIAPLFLTPLDGCSERHCGIHFIGTAQGIAPTVRTELNSFIWNINDDSVVNLLLEHLTKLSWQEWVFPDVRENSRFYEIIKKFMNENAWVCTKFRREDVYIIPTKCSFIDYLSGLGASTRLRLFNRRNIIVAKGEIELVDYRYKMNEFINILNRFHLPRWGKACFDTKATIFHERMAIDYGMENINASVILLDKIPISVLYDINVGHSIYNIQQGYKNDVSPKISLGTLHMGYAIERYCNDDDIGCYNLLVGRGKNSDYKDHLAPTRETIVSFTAVRSLRYLSISFCKRIVARAQRFLG